MPEYERRGAQSARGHAVTRKCTLYAHATPRRLPSVREHEKQRVLAAVIFSIASAV
jgi:hypothetical protein